MSIEHYETFSINQVNRIENMANDQRPKYTDEHKKLYFVVTRCHNLIAIEFVFCTLLIFLSPLFISK